MQTLIYSGQGDLSSDKGERIDIWLTKQFSYSRNFFHHIIERNGILVNNKKIKKSHKLKQGDQILIDDLSRYLSPVILDEAPNTHIPVILEKEDYLVINKPKGVLSHPNSVREVSQPSVVGFLYHNYKNLPTIGNFIRAGLLHRLDKDTDGLMIIAKTEKGLAHFKQLFQARSSLIQENISNDSISSKSIKPNHQSSSDLIVGCHLHKFYRAICYVTDQGQEFLSEISSQLPYYIQEIVIPKIPHYIPKLGITKILSFQTVTSRELQVKNNIKLDTPNSSLVKISLEILTGRTHQIRYHLSTHGLPIVGDYLYGKEEEVPMQLTAYKLEFIDSDGENQTIEI